MQHVMRMRHVVICGLFGPTTLSHKRHDFRKKKKKLFDIKCVLWFSLQLLSETFLFLRRIQRDMIKNVKRPSCTVPVILVSLSRNLEFSRQIFEYSNIKFHENPSSGSRAVPYGRTDGHDKANSRFSQRGDVFFHRIKPIQTKLNKPINIIQLPCSWQYTGNSSSFSSSSSSYKALQPI